MDHFHYRDGVLHVEDVSLEALAAEVGTPFYCYATAALIRNYEAFRSAVPQGSLIAYSVKANDNLAVLKTLRKLGAGADVVSGGELKKALAAGIAPERIVFSGVGKSRAEIQFALACGILQFNVESEPELDVIGEVAIALDRRAAIAIRVNPDVDAGTHAKINTGTAETKFGVPWRKACEVYARASSLPGIEPRGLAVHIGSQITELAPFEAAFAQLAELVQTLRAQGHSVERLDLGGGLGVPYAADVQAPPTPATYGALVARLLGGLGANFVFEPGRLIAADAGVLVTRVLYVKEGESKTFLVLDAGMNDLLRPALYDARHEILLVRAPPEGIGHKIYDVVGPVCETADLFARELSLPKARPDDLLAIMTAGAYGAVMASSYNARPPAAEVLVKGEEWGVVRQRQTPEALMALERLPHWLK